MSGLRIALFQPAPPFVGGAEILQHRHARFLADHGCVVKVVTFGGDAPVLEPRLAGVAFESVPKRHWRDGLSWSAVAKLKSRARRTAGLFADCDVVLAYNPPCSAMLGAVDLAAGKIWQCNEPPRRLHLREANPALTAHVEGAHRASTCDVATLFQEQLAVYDRAVAGGGDLRHRRAFDVECVRRLDAVYALSAFSRDNCRQIYGHCDEDPIPPIVAFPERVARRQGASRATFGVLVQSRLDPTKNIDTVVRGFAAFRRQCGEAQLHVVGRGPHRERLEQLSADLCPPESVLFHGYLDDASLSRVYATCGVFALLPVDEPFGMVFPEAAAHGLLLLGPDHGGPVEILDGGRYGWLCDAFTPEAVADALAEIRALSDTDVDRRREAADHACRTRYAEDVVGPRLLRYLERAR